MSEVKNRVVVTENAQVKKIKSDKEIVEENKKLEDELKGKVEDKDMTVMLVEQQDRSVNVGVVGVGQCGSKLAEEFYNLGYSAVAINTAMQDLKPIQIPEGQKLFLDYALGGSAKDLETGAAAAEEYSEQILSILQESFEDSEVLMLVTSGGGGTGSGSAETMVSIMTQMDKPLTVVYVLPLASEDTLAKHNSIQTLSRLAKLAKEDTINSLMVVDNAKIELLHPGKSMAEFWRVANKTIVDPLHLFNKLSSSPSEYGSLDPMDFTRIFVGTGDCTLYGMIEIEDFLEEEAIAEAVITNMENGLLASEFDLRQTRSAGVIITGSKEILQQIPATNIEYGFAMVNKLCNEGTQVFRGVYEIPGQETLKVYSLFSGLGLPEERVTELKAEAERHMAALKGKEDNRAANMSIDIGKTKAVSAADALHKKIKGKKSAMGKIKKNSKRIADRRRK
jgi:cell division GTPase FtsZ